MKMAQQIQSNMKEIRLEKVVLNMGVGKSGEAIEIAKKALDQISGKKSCARDAKATQRDWGVRKGEPIGAAVTSRGNDAIALLKRLLEAKGNQIKGSSFDNFGNVSFGILEHIDIPGIKYDPKIGILGLDVAVSLTRPGFNVRFRSKHKAKIGKSHKITSDEAKEFLKRAFGVKIV
jgi:large subunit ribosomal protein L5